MPPPVPPASNVPGYSPCLNCRRPIPLPACPKPQGASPEKPSADSFCSPECFWTGELGGAQVRSSKKSKRKAYSRPGSEVRESKENLRDMVEDEGDDIDVEANNAMFELHDLNGWT
mmetsp:Transcript_5804/g.15181  ORF Transcript_5804/g.15181 Transcript_5804/m.15181 type:complete len:116 (-) Transcript_5804:191-538(-)|eukprot:CAMPEP_0174891542 /NCGR_PEP_ID=MMETSP0167-20121228/6607_1 /TAXON_ID=38298 /ORGANISM="Rhodella maculata, Strain CCMP736" /LENGTH=115 /DNA_ID=CAMNT_0016129763 /DNA_START=144 /DNA_END=491 /DNA_ORIENTATION=-